jgi:hypothetical protein
MLIKPKATVHDFYRMQSRSVEKFKLKLQCILSEMHTKEKSSTIMLYFVQLQLTFKFYTTFSKSYYVLLGIVSWDCAFKTRRGYVYIMWPSLKEYGEK